MAGLTVFLYVLVVLAAVLLIGLILIQPAKSGGMGAAFGGIGESVFGGKAGSHLTKATVYLTAIFFIIALALAALIGHGVRLTGSGETGVDTLLDTGSKAPAKEQKAAPAPAKAPAKEQKATPAAPAKAPAKTPAAPAKAPAPAGK